MSNVSYIPAGYHTVTPYLTVKGVAGLIEFLKTTFDATEKELMKRADGSIHHAEMQIGDSVIMMGEAPANGSPRAPRCTSTCPIPTPLTAALWKQALPL
jgi:PhnB protein